MVMRPNIANLTMRDPAMAALMGALPSSDFGREVRSPDMGADFGNGGADYGFGADPYGFGAEPAHLAGPGPHVAGAAAYHAARGMRHHGGAGHQHMAHHPWGTHGHMLEALLARHDFERDLTVDPNRYSHVKVQGYSFSLTQQLTLNAPQGFLQTLQPNAKIRPTRMFANVMWPGFVTLSSVQVANVSVLLGATDDSYNYSPLAQGTVNNFPTLDTSTRATMSGDYTGFVPPGYANGFNFLFTLTFQGPAMLAGNG
jgi:hypothetical protein